MESIQESEVQEKPKEEPQKEEQLEEVELKVCNIMGKRTQCAVNFKRFKIQEGLLTNAKVYIHVTIGIKVCHSDNDVFTIIIYMIYKRTNDILCQ